MEEDLRPAIVIRAELALAKDLLASLGFDHIGGVVHFFARSRVEVLSHELRAAEGAAECLAETVALKWIYRYARDERLAFKEGLDLQGGLSQQATDGVGRRGACPRSEGQ